MNREIQRNPAIYLIIGKLVVRKKVGKDKKMYYHLQENSIYLSIR